MKKNVVIAAVILCVCVDVLASVPNNSNDTTFIGPVFRGGFNGMLTDTSGYSFAAEAGAKNLRASATTGVNFLQNHRLKLSAEFLWQQIEYAFFAGNVRNWGNQGALGAAYEYDINHFSPYKPVFILDAYYASAASSTIHTETGTYTSGGILQSFTDIQAIAGANATGISPGVSVVPWCGGKAGVDINYDNVRYDMKYASFPDQAKGWGGTIHLEQQLTNQVSVSGLAAVRQPFNHYQADIAWHTIPQEGAWVFKLIGGYTIGKLAMPDTYNVMLAADYFLDKEPISRSANEQLKQALLIWMATPAVYLPQILGVPDESVTTSA